MMQSLRWSASGWSGTAVAGGFQVRQQFVEMAWDFCHIPSQALTAMHAQRHGQGIPMVANRCLRNDLTNEYLRDTVRSIEPADAALACHDVQMSQAFSGDKGAQAAVVLL